MDLEKMTKILKGQMKGQAVMEYLITYGLALFVILIVLAILVAVVLPQLKAPDTCQFSQPGFGCSTKQHVIVSDPNSQAVNVIVQLDNQQSRDIILNGMLCSGDTAGNVVKEWITLGPNYQDTYGIPMPAGSSKTITLNCWRYDAPGGGPVVLAPGSSFKGSVALLYNYADEVSGAPERMAVATITGTVQAG